MGEKNSAAEGNGMWEKEFVEKAFQRCLERGWMKELIPSAITEQEIADFEEKYQVKLPSLFKAYLTTYRLPESDFEICGIADHAGEISPLWLMLCGYANMKDLAEAVEGFRGDVDLYGDVTAKNCGNIIPIGDWGAGWGPLYLDLAKPEELVDEEDESTWALRWFDHEEFHWDEYYLGKDGLLHGTPAAPDLKTLLEWYFCGSLEPEFEEEYQVKVSYERLNNEEFCDSYWDDKWK